MRSPAKLIAAASSPAERRAIFCLLLALATFAAYFPVLHNGFVNYDDPRYISENSHIQSGLNWQSIRWAATAYYESNWHPLTWISHAADITLFNLNPGGHHAVSVLFHAINAVLLFLIVRAATRRDWESFFVAALFALHPVNVESVAWAAERKNVLSMFFLLLALYAYGKYVERPAIGRYALVAMCFALGLAAKPQIIAFPFLLLLWDFWPLQRRSARAALQAAGGGTAAASFSSLWVEKIPLLLVAVTSAMLTLQAQSRGGALQVANAAHRAVAAYPLPVRLENALLAYARYVQMLFWPTALAPMYPHPGLGIRAVSVLFALFLVGVITALVLILWRQRYLPVGWFWFLGSLLPMIGIVQVGSQAMADRYAYVAFVGPFFMVVWGISHFGESKSARRRTVAVLAFAVVVVLGAITRRQVGFWRSSETLWKHTLQVTQGNFVAHDSLAEYLLKQSRFTEGCAQFQAAVGIFPDDMPAQEGLAVCAQARDDNPEAIERYHIVLRRAVEPGIRASAFANLASIYRGLGDYRQARDNYQAALQINPDLPIALVGSGLLAQKGWDYSLAAAQYAHAMRVEPTSVGYLLLSGALRQSGHSAEAAQALQKAQELSANLQNDHKIAESLLAQ